MLASGRQVDAVLAAELALDRALQTLASGDPIDLVASDLLEAVAALRTIAGHEASEALLDAIFARFCIGK